MISTSARILLRSVGCFRNKEKARAVRTCIIEIRMYGRDFLVIDHFPSGLDCTP